MGLLPLVAGGTALLCEASRASYNLARLMAVDKSVGLLTKTSALILAYNPLTKQLTC